MRPTATSKQSYMQGWRLRALRTRGHLAGYAPLTHTCARPLPLWPQVLVCIVLLNLLIAIMNTTYSKIAHNAWLEWYWQFADLVLRSERTWLGELLKTRQLLVREQVWGARMRHTPYAIVHTP